MLTALGRTVVLAADLDAALAFYRDVLGFAVLHDAAADGYRYLHVGIPGQDGAGLWIMPATSEADRALVGRQAGDHPFLVVYSDDLDAVRATLAARHIEILNERADADSRSLHFRDALGNVLVAVQLTG